MARLLAAAAIFACGCIGGSNQLPPAAAAPSPSGSPPGSGSPPPSASECTTDPAAAGTLLEPCAVSIRAVSPDGNRVLVAPTLHSLPVGLMEPVGLSLVTRGQDTRVLTPTPIIADGSFAPDGRSIVFETAEYGQYADLNLARADGSGVRRLALRHNYLAPGRFALAGPWLYYTEESDAALSLYRVHPPDGAPELLADFRRAGEGSAALWGTTSPDGESVAYWFWSSLGRPADGYLQWAGSATPLRLPTTEDYRWWAIWAPDGSWLLIHPCVLVDMAGSVQTLCDASNWTAECRLSRPTAAFSRRLQRTAAGGMST